MKTLECHSRGDRRFSPFFCWVDAFGQFKSIENHYHCSKLFQCGTPADWKEAKQWVKAGYHQVGWKIGDMILPVRSDGKRYFLNDFGVQWYILLWYKHLTQPDNQWKIKYVREFDDFNDPFKGSFPFCQAEVMRKVKNEGLDGLKQMADELWNLLSLYQKGSPMIIEYDLLDIQYGIIAHQVNLKGVMGAGLAKQIRSCYPIVYEQYLDFLPNAELGSILAVPVSEHLTVVNLFGQADIGRNKQQTDVVALKQCLIKLQNFADNSMPIYLPYQLGCGLGGGDWDEVLQLINDHLLCAIICQK